MQLFDAICARTSIRVYTSDALTKEQLVKLVDAGRRAPSARAVEPWEFVVVREKSTLQKIGQVAVNGSFITQAAAAIIVFSKDTKYYLEDGCAATENILLAAADLGLGACWIAGDKKDYAAWVCELVGATAKLRLISIIALGISAEVKKQSKHRSLENVLHWERF